MYKCKHCLKFPTLVHGVCDGSGNTYKITSDDPACPNASVHGRLICPICDEVIEGDLSKAEDRVILEIIRTFNTYQEAKSNLFKRLKEVIPHQCHGASKSIIQYLNAELERRSNGKG